MDTANLRRCFNLYRSETGRVSINQTILSPNATRNWLASSASLYRQIGFGLFILFTLLAHSSVQAQGSYKYVRKHLERYDDKDIHYGFFFAAPITRFSVGHSPSFLTADSAYRIYSPNKFSFRVGFVVNAFLNDRFDLRLTPAVSLYSREVLYDYPNSAQKKETRESTWIDLPLLLKYKSERRNNSRMYLLAGGSFSIETNVRRQENQGTSRLSTGNMDLAVEYGVGFEQFFEFFKFAPELRFSHGLLNLYRPTTNIAGIGINKLTTHTVTLYLNFE